MKKLLTIICAVIVFSAIISRKDADAFTHKDIAGSSNILAPIAVSGNGKYLVDADGKPFLWIADTAWGLNQRLTRE